MRFSVLFTDNEELANKRQEYMQDHLAFLSLHSGSILGAGPLFKTTTGLGAGGMWIVEADALEDVEKLVREDPFHPTGLRKNIEICEWKLVFENGVKKN
ncbi:MAG: YciI family protein [Halopseudomonas aestusnigri]